MFGKSRWLACPVCGNERKGDLLCRCKACGGVYCPVDTGRKMGLPCPYCGDFRIRGPEILGKIDARRGAPFRLDPRPKRPPIPVVNWGGDGSSDPSAIDWPESPARPTRHNYGAAPSGAARIGHEPPPSGYTRENAIEALERSNVDRSRPQDQEQALHLARYMGWVLKDRAWDFIEDAARDESLPMSVRAFYIHAAQMVGRA